MFCDNHVCIGRTVNTPAMPGSANKVSAINLHLLLLCRAYGTKTGDNAACFG